MSAWKRGAEVLRAEAEAVAAAADRLGESFTTAVDILGNASGQAVVSGIGKSGHVGRKISATLASLGTPSVFMHASEALHGDLGMLSSGDVAVLLSNSGTTPEVVEMVPLLQMRKIPIVAFTADPDSLLGRAADAILDTAVEREADNHNLAPTTSTAVMMAMGDALAVALADRNGFTPRDFALFHPAGALGKKLQRVGDLMAHHAPLPAVAPDTPLLEALKAMTAGKLGVVVALEGGRLVGLLTDGDVRRIVQQNESVEEALAAPISVHMTKEPRTVSPEIGAGAALRAMEDSRISCMPVTADGVLVGIIHLHDLVRAGIGMQNRA
ncbi:KpsF/GutQ family sugar-phosphate isomerase [bacterium]|nr:KpsF/GutQ family sugar-phosphate isomerase [bacterium]